MVDIAGNEKEKIVLFSLGEPRYALYLSVVEKVVLAVEIIPLPKAPDIIFGVVNYHGNVIPVIDIRKRFRLPYREITLDDQFIIAKTSKRLVILVVDSVSGVYELDKYQIVDTAEEFPFTTYLSGITKIDTNIVLINDLEKFLSLDEERKLEGVL